MSFPDISPATWATFALILLLFHGVRKHIQMRSSLPLPPGPKKLPLVGNLFNMPSTYAWEACVEWSKIYNSDIIHLDLAGTSVIVLSTLEATEALLEKRSSIYSDRAPSPMLTELMGWDFNLGLMKYGDEWRTHRRLMNQEFNVHASRSFRPKERVAAHGFLRHVLRDPNQFLEHLRQMVGEVILSVTYGIDALSADDPYLSMVEKAAESLKIAMVPGRFLVDSIPILKYVPEWVPGANFKRIAREWKEVVKAVQDAPFAEVKRRMASGSAPSSFTADSLRALELTDKYYKQETVKGTAATMYSAAVDTTVASLSTFILAMLANPQAQKKAQDEIDSVIAAGHLPDFGDEEAMPYVAALIKEVLRWGSVVPFGVPHFLAVEDEYEGYRLPAGSIVMGNIWGILHDEDMYPEPHTFKPERFLIDGKPNPSVKNPHAVFGFGRRICPGRHMATSAIWITAVSMLSVFDISKAVGEDGEVIEPSYKYTQGVLITPVPFKCSIKPRSREAIALIQATANEI
ncbi:cytochrome P450 [Mycena vulgaris]|nr:cytochrome P450 [Mycena vulgaris]